jgi:hypothetical protein
MQICVRIGQKLESRLSFETDLSEDGRPARAISLRGASFALQWEISKIC